MKLFEQYLLIELTVIVLLAISQVSYALESKTILFGVNYLPQVTCVEDFSPYWITDNWTEKRMITDLKIMKAIGCSCVRFHIYPAMPSKSTIPGVNQDKFLPMLDLGVKTAGEIGLRVHLDMNEGVDEVGEEGVRLYVTRYLGRIESYQIGDEHYGYGGDPKKLRWLQGLFELTHSIDPKAKISADLFVPDIVKIRDEMPDLYKQINMLMRQYYPVTDYRGWNDIYIADLVDHLGNPTGRKTAMQTFAELRAKNPKAYDQYDAKVEWYDHPFYEGSFGWLDKEVWITELTACGYWRSGNVIAEDIKASGWGKVIDAIANAKNRLTRVYHHCFRDKMSWREFGMGECGIVYYDGAPKPSTFVFKKMAVKYSSSDSPMRDLDCDIERAVVPEGGKTVDLKIRLTNKTRFPLNGEAVLELPDKASAKSAALRFSLPPMKSKVWKTLIDVGEMNWGNNHVFVKINIPRGLVYGWGIIAKPKRLEINTAPSLKPELSSKVRYAQGYEAVQAFLDKYGDECAIIVGPGMGTDAEMGYRLKTVIQAIRCREVPIKHSAVATEVLNRPIIVIGSPEYNLISRTVEMALPEDQRVTKTNPGEGKGVIHVIDQPLGKRRIAGRDSQQAQQLGYFFGGVPEVLYMAGPDDDGTKAAVYDLILRLWGSEKKYE